MVISFNKDEKVNICGISENNFDPDGWCRKCKNTCEMIPQVMIDKKVYEYAKRNGIIKGNILGTYTSMFSNSEFVNYFRDEKKYKRAPEYVKKYLKALEEEFNLEKRGKGLSI
ncbi:hypothetical protein [Lacrimispora amygdalina]|uniref:hypothetical protein n=1 Tax=Lacrimispora amygdalina TaxID=253257 RepID=UPI000BE42FB3|nr:hypothetical protein [Lacrimispora amygdalina]